MRKSYPLALLVGLLALSACGKKPQEEPVDNDITIEEPENLANDDVEAPAPPPVENVAKPVENKVAPPEISEEEQMQDDAEATGMTSRLPGNDEASAVVGGKVQ